MSTHYLLRHAESQPSLDCPEPDWPLSPLGETQAQKLASQLKAFNICHIYTSPYLRAQQTITPFQAKNKLPLDVIHDLRERKLASGWLENWLESLKKTWLDFDFYLPGGESSRQCQTRIVSTIQDLSQNHPGKNTLYSSHGNAIALYLNHINPQFDFKAWQQMKNPALYEVKSTPKQGWVYHEITL